MSEILPTSDERATPPELFKLLDYEFHFTCDVAAWSDNKKCEKYYDFTIDGLKQDWSKDVNFLNPPFSAIKQWLRKARAEAEKGALTVVILPNDSSTQWFHEFIWDKAKREFRVPVFFPDKRYKFGTYSNASKFAVLIAIFGKKDE